MALITHFVVRRAFGHLASKAWWQDGGDEDFATVANAQSLSEIIVMRCQRSGLELRPAVPETVRASCRQARTY